MSRILNYGSLNLDYVYDVEHFDAGDTFTGYFVALRAAGEDVETALDLASQAAALACSKKGAAASIPEITDINMKRG